MLRRLLSAALIAAGLALGGPALHDAIPHEGLHAAFAQAGTCPADAHDASRWHPPVDPIRGCAFGHEHGDAPPRWIADAGYQAGFDGAHGFHGNTSPAENTTKHTSMKGVLGTLAGQEVYVRLHWASNVMERSARYHSYEVFLKDAAGRVSHWQGWTNTGDPDLFRGANDPLPGPTDPTPGRVSKAARDDGRRPVVLVTDYDALSRGLNCEQWYANTASWSWDLGLTICDSTTMAYPWEKYLRLDGSPFQGAGVTDPINWIKLCDYGYDAALCRGANREVEIAWYGPDSKAAPNRGNPPKDVEFWATQFGEIVAGPSDPRCAPGAMTTKFGVGYQNQCLDQYIASTARAVENPGNRVRKTFDTTGVEVPN